MTALRARVRAASLADRLVLQSFHRALYIEHRDRVMPDKLRATFARRDFVSVLNDDVDAMLASAQRGECIILLAERSAPEGYITGRIDVDETRVLRRRGTIEDWWVEPEARSQGTGRLLAETMIEIFRTAGCELVESATWAFNAGARRAHEQLGFVESEIRYRRPV